ncbi:MAG TPA: hypothetical protein VK169_00700 [Saprospiraceae bacterium]|nr:hypothetical protein [Saprospiraceae bacterium]
MSTNRWQTLNITVNSKEMRNILVLLLVIIFQNLSAQQELPIIRANSKNVKILDGINYKSNFWVIFPETKPDIYYLDLPRKATHVKFITDIDSISFTMNYGEAKDFIVLLNGKDSCYTRISANYPNLKLPKKVKQGNDTIPFTMKDNRIYFKGKINDSELLNIQFDLGADAVNLNKKSSNKININFDKKGNLINSDGINETNVSSKNEIEIQGLTWSGIEIYETKNMENYEDVIIGNSFFLDQIYKIDYENSVLILYDKLPEIETDYLKQNMILDNGVRPVFEATFKIDNKNYTEWFLFDTGNTGNGIVGNSFLVKHNLYDKFSNIIGFGNKKVAFIPELIIANQTISKGVITLEKQNKNESDYKFGGLIGNKILKRFNVIIDNREGLIYMKPNFFFLNKTASG